MHLSNDALQALERRPVAVPTYDRGALRRSIVHVGVGGFHRAHQLVYLDKLARSGNLDWGETGVGLHTPTMKQALRPQDGLCTVVERGGSGKERATVVGAMPDYLFAPDDPQAVLARLADAETRIVTLTVTGDGYRRDACGETGEDPTSLRVTGSGALPTTWFGYVVAALARRRAEGLGGFTVLSCDNLADSAGAAQDAVVGLAETMDPGLASWIRRHVSFPGSMVDRITPVPGDAAARLVAHRYGVSDRAPVLTEPFSQWVIEDAFAAGRPPLEDVGVEFTSDVAPYKRMKSRLLNGTHSAMAYLGHLAGHRTTAEVMTDPVMRSYLDRLMRDEIAPLLGSLPGVDLAAYRATLLDRFANQHVSDPLTRLCGRGSTKVPAYLLPSLVDARDAGRPAPLLTLAVAGWFRYLEGQDLAGRPIDVVDSRRDELMPLARTRRGDPTALLGVRDLMGTLKEDPWVRRELTSALLDIERLGPQGAMARRLECITTRPIPQRRTKPLEGMGIG